MFVQTIHKVSKNAINPIVRDYKGYRRFGFGLETSQSYNKIEKLLPEVWSQVLIYLLNKISVV